VKLDFKLFMDSMDPDDWTIEYLYGELLSWVDSKIDIRWISEPEDIYDDLQTTIYKEWIQGKPIPPPVVEEDDQLYIELTYHSEILDLYLKFREYGLQCSSRLVNLPNQNADTILNFILYHVERVSESEDSDSDST